MRSGVALLAALVPCLAALGCGLGAGHAPKGVQLLVSRDFGAHVLSEDRAPKVVGQETVMALLLRNHHVKTRFGGGFVQGLDGLEGGREGGRPVDWFYYVNGVEAPQGAAATNLRGGDHVWWDRHDWTATEHIPAVVGSFPEPFLDGIEGKRLPVRVECTAVGSPACDTVTHRLRAAGVPAAISGFGSGPASLILRVVVAPWQALENDTSVSTIARGPGQSGVYARFAPRGSSLMLLDQDGAVARTLTHDAGLIAATRSGQNAPVWVVTGTDAQGVAHAADAFDAASLDDHFALALDGTTQVPLPEVAR